MKNRVGLSMFTVMLSSAALALVIDVQGARAAGAEQGQQATTGQTQAPTISQEGDTVLKLMQDHALKMHEMMHQIMLEQDPKKKEQLMAEQRQQMRQHMQQMAQQRSMMRGLYGPPGVPGPMGPPPGARPPVPPGPPMAPSMPEQPGTGTSQSGQTGESSQ